MARSRASRCAKEAEERGEKREVTGAMILERNLSTSWLISVTSCEGGGTQHHK